MRLGILADIHEDVPKLALALRHCRRAVLLGGALRHGNASLPSPQQEQDARSDGEDGQQVGAVGEAELEERGGQNPVQDQPDGHQNHAEILGLSCDSPRRSAGLYFRRDRGILSNQSGGVGVPACLMEGCP